MKKIRKLGEKGKLGLKIHSDGIRTCWSSQKAHRRRTMNSWDGMMMAQMEATCLSFARRWQTAAPLKKSERDAPGA
ncbi:hypothetical protein AB2F98_01650 [Escherichia coli]